MHSGKIPFQTFYATTQDGWRIALHRYPRLHSKRSPVFLVHGLASNRFYFDFPLGDKSFAKHLWRKGWDTWLIDLRGAGCSTKPNGLEWFFKKWSFDQYLFHDLPTALRFILDKTRRSRVHWIGHSLGGVLIYPFVKIYSAASIQSVTLLGTPLTANVNPDIMKWASWLSPLLRFVPIIPYRALIQILKLRPSWLAKSKRQAFIRKMNLDAETVQVIYQKAVEDVSAELFRQVNRWLSGKSFLSADGKMDFWFHPKNFQLPLLILTGANDPVTPLRETESIFKMIGSRKKKWVVCGKANGFKSDYGHIDLILGRNSPKEIYPVLSGWLKENERVEAYSPKDTRHDSNL